MLKSQAVKGEHGPEEEGRSPRSTFGCCALPGERVGMLMVKPS